MKCHSQILLKPSSQSFPYTKKSTKVKEMQLIIEVQLIAVLALQEAPNWTHRNPPWSLLGWQQGLMSGERQRSPDESAWGMTAPWLGGKQGTQRLRLSSGFGAQWPFENLGGFCGSEQLQEGGHCCESPPSPGSAWAHVKGQGWLLTHVFDNLAAGHPWTAPILSDTKLMCH